MRTFHLVCKALLITFMALGLYIPSVQAHHGPDFSSDDRKLYPMTTQRLEERIRPMQVVKLPDFGLTMSSLQELSLVGSVLSLQRLALIIGPDKKASDVEFPWPLPIAP